MMGRIVGNIFCMFVCILYSHFAFASSLLRVLDINRSPLVQAGIGRPFLIEVSASNVEHLDGYPHINGLEKFEVKNSGLYITDINGKRTLKYLFEVRIDTPGTYTIGPAIFDDSQIGSNSVSVVVGKEEQLKEGNVKEQGSSVLLRLSADKEQVTVGERVRCCLRFYATDSSVSLLQLIEQEAQDFYCKKAHGPYRGKECLNGIDYDYIEWQRDVFPKKAGNCVIPAYGANYEKEVERDHFWGGLGRFIGNHSETKRVYSNAISLKVDELPSSDKPIQAIGNFSSLIVSAQPPLAKQGEGIVVAVEITGDGDPDAIAFEGLTNVPEALRFYESNQSVQPTQGADSFKKRFECIVQGLKVGTWEIPAQTFYYFDTNKRAFNTLQSTPLSITIMPNAKKKITKQLPNNEQKSNSSEDDLAPLHKDSWYYVAPFQAALPWWLFVVLLLLPVLILLYHFLLPLVRKNRPSYRTQRAKKAFIFALKRLEKIKKKNTPQELYTLFVELFADRWQEPIAAISIDTIRKRLQKTGSSDKQLDEWNDFFSVIAERAFGMKKTDTDEDLFKKAEQWIRRLEKQL